MKKALFAASAALVLALPVSAQDEPDARSSNEPIAQTETPTPSPNDIVDAASPDEWVAIAAEDLLVMTLAPDAQGNEREVVIQLMPPPFSQGWVENIRTLARAEWYDGISVNRVQDNYVVQWGDPGYDNPESGETETKPLPDWLNVVGEDDYVVRANQDGLLKFASRGGAFWNNFYSAHRKYTGRLIPSKPYNFDSYSRSFYLANGWQFSLKDDEWAPVHCYGMVGVGRNYSPDTGSGAELYTVIGHAPRHLDRNIALVGRIITGMEHLSSLPRGSGVLGFYTEEEADKRTPILSVRVASDLAESEQPAFEYLSTESKTFAKYAEARANRRDPFFIQPAGGVDICNIPIPVRSAEQE